MDNSDKLGIILFIVVFFGFSTIFISETYSKQIEQKKRSSIYEEQFLEEDKAIFETYNEEYENKTDKDSRRIVVEVNEENVKLANNAIENYISNVNGQLVSLNGKSIIEKAWIPLFGTIVDVEKNNVYIIAVPKKAKFSYNLQDRLDKYLKYKKPKQVKPIISIKKVDKNKNS